MTGHARTATGALMVVIVVVTSVLVASALLPEQAQRRSTEGVPTPTQMATPLATALFADARVGLDKMVQKSSPQDTQYLDQGRFRYEGAECLRCELGPAVAAAALSRRTGDAGMKHIALSVMDTALQAHLQPDGSWGPPAAAKEGNAIDTAFFAEHLGMMMYALWPDFDAAYRTRYALVLTRAADSLVARKNNVFYVNGNINLGVTVVLGMAWHFSGEEKYHRLYEDSFDFVLHPGSEWPGFGLQLTEPASATTGRAGYLAEKGPNAPGYDPGYTQFQADLAASGYTVLRDERLLELTDMLTNQLLRGVDQSTWTLDVRNGSRGTNPSRTAPFTTPALLVSALNGRSDRKATATLQAETAGTLYAGAADRSWSGMYQSWGTQIATLLMWV